MSDDHLLPLPEDDGWRDRAACRTTPTAVFFEPERTLEALAICRVDERYCEIAAKRLAQGVLDLGGAA